MKKIIVAAFIAFGIVSCSDNGNLEGDVSGIKTTRVEASFGNSFLQPNQKNGNTI
jgi:hypothetical protein